MPTALGKRLVEARRGLGWSLREVERRTGIHNAHLSQIEKGTIERPDAHVLWLLASVYELDPQELLRLAGHIQRAGSQSVSHRELSAALRALGDLTTREQREVLRFMAEVRRRRDPNRRSHG